MRSGVDRNALNGKAENDKFTKHIAVFDILYATIISATRVYVLQRGCMTIFR
jgi:hypothetical protein